MQAVNPTPEAKLATTPDQPGIKSIFFGSSPLDRNYDSAVAGSNANIASCAINAGNVIIEVHTEYEVFYGQRIYGRVGSVGGVTVYREGQSPTLVTAGEAPSVALADDNVCVIVSEFADKLQYSVGTVTGDHIQFLATGRRFPDTIGSAHNPSVALARNGFIVEVHESGAGLYWRQGILDGETLTWDVDEHLLQADGRRPFVAVNNVGDVVFVWESGTTLCYVAGQYDRRRILPASLGQASPASFPYDVGARPTISLNDESYIFALHSRDGGLYQRTGRIEPLGIFWQDVLGAGNQAVLYDDVPGGGDPLVQPHIASNGKVAVQVFARFDNNTPPIYVNPPNNNQILGYPTVLATHRVYTTACLILDRANWMGDHRGQLQDKTLREIALPGSHDAGAFAVDRARTQDLSFAGQLAYGVRYFDVRPKFTGDKSVSQGDLSHYFTYHDIGIFGDYLGPNLDTVIREVRAFMQSHRELVILKISHYNRFDKAIFGKLAYELTHEERGLGPWVYKPQDGEAVFVPRLARRKLSEFLKPDRGTVLILADTDGSTDYVEEDQHADGILRYRDWYAANPEQGDVTVFDVFSDVASYPPMPYSAEPDSHYASLPGSRNVLPKGQLRKFHEFDGMCRGTGSTPGTTPCDLFLLSWTVTPKPATPSETAFDDADPAARELVENLGRKYYSGEYNGQRITVQGTTFQNGAGQYVNVLYTDAVEFSRSVDVAMVRSGLVGAVQPTQKTATA
jgi:hypothetical protein